MLTPPPLTFEEKLSLQPGDRVRHRSGSGHEQDVTVRRRPVLGVTAEWIIGFEEVPGNYLLQSVVGILSRHHHVAGEK